MKAYADSSFLVSLYAPDANSEAAQRHARRWEHTVIVTPFTELEVTNALLLRLFRRELTEREAFADIGAFESDLAGGVFDRQAHPNAAFERAVILARKHTTKFGCRSLDILHVAAALAMEVDVFHTFDRRQQRLARAERMKTPVRIRD